MRTRRDISALVQAVIVTVMMLCWTLPAHAISTIAVTSPGNGVFLLQGVEIENAAAFEITAAYDAAALANPRVAMGPLVAGGMNAVNTNVPGKIQIVIVRLTPVKGSGVIASITFDRTGTSPGAVTMLSAKLANMQGAHLPSTVLINNPTDPQATASERTQDSEHAPGQEVPDDTDTAAQIAPPPIIIAGPSSRDTATTVPGDADSAGGTVQANAGGQEGSDSGEPLIADRSTEERPGEDDKEPSQAKPARRIFSQKGALERFEEYRGERSIRAFLSLFDQESLLGYRQDPAVALSDGKTPVKVTFVTTPGNKTASDIAVLGARFLSMRSDPDYSNTWIVELLPERGACEASLTVFQGDLVMVYPLTVAPVVALERKRPSQATEKEFRRSVAARLKARSPKLDVNRDGKWDYRDDFIVIANYLHAVTKGKKE